MRIRITRVLLPVLLVAVSAWAQNISSPAKPTLSSPADHGTFAYISNEVGHDNVVGWSVVDNFSLGYDFSKHLSVQAGIPVYFVSTSKSTTNGTTTKNTVSNEPGDLAFQLNYDPGFNALHWKAVGGGTAPTGDQNAGLGAGAPTWNFANEVSRDIGFVTPVAQVTLGNGLTSTRRIRRPFTSYGDSATLRGGLNFDLTHTITFEASVYDVQPWGTQTVYSRVVGNGATGMGKKKNPFQSQHKTVGGADLTEDHGFTGEFTFNPAKRIDVDIAYNRSIIQRSDTVIVTVGWRFGHLAGVKPVVE